MTLSRSQRYLAWSEEAETGIIVVFDLQNPNFKKKTISAYEAGCTYYQSLSFHPKEESKYLVALSSGPEWNLILWDWNRCQCVGTIKLGGQYNLYHCFYHPKEEDFICIIGQQTFKGYNFKTQKSYTPTSLVAKGKDQKETQHSPNYISYCLLKDDNLIVGTDQGELLLFNINCEYKMVLSTSPLDGLPIESIVVQNRGFFVASSSYTVHCYDRQEDLKNPYVKLDKKFQSKDIKSKITSMLLSTADDSLILGLENGQIVQTSSNQERNGSEDNIRFEHVI